MPIDDVKDVDTGKETSNRTQVPVDRNAISDLKAEAGCGTNTEASPLVAAAVYEYLGQDDRAADMEDEFRAQFEDKE